MYGGVLEVQGGSSDQEPEVTAHPSANALVERRGNGFAALAGRSTDGKTVQIFIANYAIPDSQIVKMHAAGTETNAPQGIWLPPRTDIVHRDNAGYDLMVSSLPWGKKAFSPKRYRLSATQNLERVERRSGSGGSLRLSHPLPTDTVELIVMERTRT